MYSLNEYGQMLADNIRTRAYTAALQRVVRPGAVVVEIGTGVGFFALMAARMGAGRVYAFEPSPSIYIANQVVAANGGGPIQLIRAKSNQVELTERADVILSDLRGSVPIFADHLPTIVDARMRILKPDGALIPQRDRIWIALVESEPLYGRTIGVWKNIKADINMDPALEAQVCTPMKTRLTPAELLSDGRCWHTLEYGVFELESLASTVTLVASRKGVCHGYAMWFDTDLWDDVGFSNHPAKPAAIYGQMFFPWRNAVSLEANEAVTCSVRADLIGTTYIWAWSAITSNRELSHSTRNLPEVEAALDEQLSPSR